MEEEVIKKNEPVDYEMTATTMFGLEEVLCDELLKIGAKEITKHNRIVNFVGDKGFMYKANLCLRTALKVLVPIHRFIANNEQRLYDGIKEIDWNTYLEKEDTLAVEATLNTDNFNHSQFVAQKTKDAIVDQFRDKFGVRPDVDLQHPTVKINVHIFRDEVTVSLDSSGPSLYKRGYREDTNLAPLKEVLAAGMILLSGWDKRTTFIDPMCGSGTLLTEAALIANNIPPGYYRKEFGFMKWKDFDQELWDTIYDAAINKITDHQQTIIGVDISSNVLKKAKENIKNCKVDDIVKVQCASMFDFVPPKTRGTVIINPPYGERMDKDGDVNVLYKQIGDKLKKDFAGYTAWMISSNLEAIKHIGLRPTRKITLYNGMLECKFLKFELYEGTKKIHKLEKNKEQEQ